jgi:hypothetical protein
MTNARRFPAFLLIFLLAIHGTSRSADIVSQYTSLALQGDLRTAETMFASTPGSQKSLLALDLEERFKQRFVQNSETLELIHDHPFVNEVIDAYQIYWVDALMNQADHETGTKRLEKTLEKLLGTHFPDTTLDSHISVEARAAEALEQYQLHVSFQRTGLFRDLLVWKNQNKRNYSVELTDKLQLVTVVFMSDFLSHGWRDYATFGTSPTSGWADTDFIYCVDWFYDRTSESFQVSFLKHEARHQADFERFPGLPVADLEYRAKLTELIYARKSVARLLATFRSSGADNPESPHAHANFRVIRGLEKELHLDRNDSDFDPWSVVRVEEVNAAALRLLQDNNRQLSAAGR